MDNLATQLRLARQYGISSINQILTIGIISDGDYHHPTEIAAKIGVSTSSFTEITDKLRERKLVFRVRARFDRRRYFIVLSPKGKEYVQASLSTETRHLSAA